MIGRVKWFNKDVGYGFIRGADDEDIFVHHISLRPVKNDCYRYLLEGEYVEYEEGPSNDDRYTKQALNVRGINGGELMCEVRRSRGPGPSKNSTGPSKSGKGASKKAKKTQEEKE